jgi:hypothetical protein
MTIEANAPATGISPIVNPRSKFTTAIATPAPIIKTAMAAHRRQSFDTSDQPRESDLITPVSGASKKEKYEHALKQAQPA